MPGEGGDQNDDLDADRVDDSMANFIANAIRDEGHSTSDGGTGSDDAATRARDALIEDAEIVDPGPLDPSNPAREGGASTIDDVRIRVATDVRERQSPDEWIDPPPTDDRRLVAPTASSMPRPPVSPLSTGTAPVEGLRVPPPTPPLIPVPTRPFEPPQIDIPRLFDTTARDAPEPIVAQPPAAKRVEVPKPPPVPISADPLPGPAVAPKPPPVPITPAVAPKPPPVPISADPPPKPVVAPKPPPVPVTPIPEPTPVVKPAPVAKAPRAPEPPVTTPVEPVKAPPFTTKPEPEPVQARAVEPEPTPEPPAPPVITPAVATPTAPPAAPVKPPPFATKPTAPPAPTEPTKAPPFATRATPARADESPAPPQAPAKRRAPFGIGRSEQPSETPSETPTPPPSEPARAEPTPPPERLGVPTAPTALPMTTPPRSTEPPSAPPASPFRTRGEVPVPPRESAPEPPRTERKRPFGRRTATPPEVTAPEVTASAPAAPPVAPPSAQIPAAPAPMPKPAPEPPKPAPEPPKPPSEPPKATPAAPPAPPPTAAPRKPKKKPKEASPTPPPTPAPEPTPPAREPELVGAASVRRVDGRVFAAAPPRTRGADAPFRGVLVALRTLLRQRRRVLLSVVAVALGVGYLAGSLSLLQRVSNGLAVQSGAGTEKADLVVEGAISTDTPLEQVRRLVSDSLAEPLRSIPGVAAVSPRIEGNAQIIGANGIAVVGLGLTERPIGANWPSDQGLNPYHLLAGGAPPVEPTDVVIDQTSATKARVAVGGSIVIVTKTSQRTYRVTGLVSDTNKIAGSTLALFEESSSRELLDFAGDDSALAIRLAKGTSRDATENRIRQILPGLTEVTDGATYTEHRQTALAKSFALIRILLAGFAGLALVVGAFTVANSMALLFDHRRRGFALLRLIGAAPSQLVGAALGEAVIAGVGAGGLGLGFGLGMGWAIERAVSSLGTPIPMAGSGLTWWIPLLAVGVGMLITVLTALAPARLASTTAPVQAVTGTEGAGLDRDRRATMVRRVVWIAIVTVGAAAIGWSIGGASSAPLAAAIGAGAAIVLAALPPALSAVVGRITTQLIGRSKALRTMSALRSRQARTRAAATTAALLLAVAVVVGLSVLSTSFVASITRQVHHGVKADLVVDSATFTRGGLSAELLPRLRSIPGVADVSGLRNGGEVTINRQQVRVGGVDGASVFRLLDLEVKGTTPDSLGDNGLAVSTETARNANLHVDSVVPVTFANGNTVSLRVTAIYNSQLSLLLGGAIVDSAVVAAQLPQSVDIIAFVGLVDRAGNETKAEVTRVSKEFGAASVTTPDKFVTERTKLLRGFSRVIQWMVLFSVAHTHRRREHAATQRQRAPSRDRDAPHRRCHPSPGAPTRDDRSGCTFDRRHDPRSGSGWRCRLRGRQGAGLVRPRHGFGPVDDPHRRHDCLGRIHVGRRDGSGAPGCWNSPAGCNQRPPRHRTLATPPPRSLDSHVSPCGQVP